MADIDTESVTLTSTCTVENIGGNFYGFPIFTSINHFDEIESIRVTGVDCSILTGYDMFSYFITGDELSFNLRIKCTTTATDISVRLTVEITGRLLDPKEWMRRYFWKDTQKPQGSGGSVTNSWQESSFTPSSWRVSSQNKEINYPPQNGSNDGLTFYYNAVPSFIIQKLITLYPDWKCAVQMIYQGTKCDTTSSGGSNRGSWQWSNPLKYKKVKDGQYYISEPQRYIVEGSVVTGTVIDDTKTPLFLTSLAETWEHEPIAASWTNDTEAQHMNFIGTASGTEYNSAAYGVPPEYRQVGWRNATIFNGGFYDNKYLYDGNFYNWPSGSNDTTTTALIKGTKTIAVTRVGNMVPTSCKAAYWTQSNMLLSDGSFTILNKFTDTDEGRIYWPYHNVVNNFFKKHKVFTRFNYTPALIFYENGRPDLIIYGPLCTVENDWTYKGSFSEHIKYVPNSFTCGATYADEGQWHWTITEASFELPKNIRKRVEENPGDVMVYVFYKHGVGSSWQKVSATNVTISTLSHSCRIQSVDIGRGSPGAGPEAYIKLIC